MVRIRSRGLWKRKSTRKTNEKMKNDCSGRQKKADDNDTEFFVGLVYKPLVAVLANFSFYRMIRQFITKVTLSFVLRYVLNLVDQ